MLDPKCHLPLRYHFLDQRHILSSSQKSSICFCISSTNVLLRLNWISLKVLKQGSIKCCQHPSLLARAMLGKDKYWVNSQLISQESSALNTPSWWLDFITPVSLFYAQVARDCQWVSMSFVNRSFSERKTQSILHRLISQQI